MRKDHDTPQPHSVTFCCSKMEWAAALWKKQVLLAAPQNERTRTSTFAQLFTLGERQLRGQGRSSGVIV